ncbi:MAG: aspartate aminotransferase family protein [Rubrobacteraceae bacterium]
MTSETDKPFEQAGNGADRTKEPSAARSAGRRDRQPGKPYFWHGFANMAAIDSADELVIVRGEGCEVFDREGRGYLDATAALWFCNVGYGRRSIVAAVEQQMSALPAYSTFGTYANEPALELSGRISRLAPLPDGKVFLTCDGSGAVDTAAKMVRRYWHEVGRHEKQIIIGRDFAYHGMHAFGTSLAGISVNAHGYGQLVPSVSRVPYDSVEALAEEFERLGPENVAAFVGEPVVGAGGVYPPPEDYWPEVAELCRENDVLLIADEVVTAFGRLGRWFGCERYGFEPDLIVFAKGVTSGYIPLGGVVVGPRVQEPFWSGDGVAFKHGYTYSGHATACAAALANLDIIEDEELVERVADFEPGWNERISALAEHPLVHEVRVAGLLGAVELSGEEIEARPNLVEDVIASAREEGILTRSVGGTAIHLSPPFVITEEQVDKLAAGLYRAIDNTA